MKIRQRKMVIGKKNGTICLPCSTGTDVIPVSGYPVSKAAIMSFQYYYVTKPSPNGRTILWDLKITEKYYRMNISSIP